MARQPRWPMAVVTVPGTTPETACIPTRAAPRNGTTTPRNGAAAPNGTPRAARGRTASDGARASEDPPRDGRDNAHVDQRP